MIMSRGKKNDLVESVLCDCKDTALLIIKNNGVPAFAASMLRDLIFTKKLGNMLVVKNKILCIILKQYLNETQDLSGAHFFFYTSDIVALTKLIDAFFKDDFIRDKIDFLCGYGKNKKILNSSDINDIINLPPKEVLIHKVALALRYPLIRITGVKLLCLRIAFCIQSLNK